MALSDKQRVFVQEYLQCFNATEAARRAGYSGDDTTLASVGYENLRKPHISELIDIALQDKVMGTNEALSRMSEIARGEYSRYIECDDDGPSVNVEMMVADSKAHLIKSLTPTQYGVKIEFCDMQAALNTILKHHGALADISGVMNIDLDKLTDDQLERIAKGENIVSVIATPGKSRA